MKQSKSTVPIAKISTVDKPVVSPVVSSPSLPPTKKLESVDCIYPPLHQEHILHSPMYGIGFRCEDVLFMEKKYGRHAEGCGFVGFIAATKCCKKG